MSIEIEKIVSGHGTGWVDGKWRARSIPENYPGPREPTKTVETLEIFLMNRLMLA